MYAMFYLILNVNYFKVFKHFQHPTFVVFYINLQVVNFSQIDIIFYFVLVNFVIDGSKWRPGIIDDGGLGKCW